MANKKRARSPHRRIPVKGGQAKWIVLLVVLLCLLVLFIIGRVSAAKEKAAVAEGVAYLNKIDSDSALAQTEEKIKEQRADAFVKLVEESSSGDGSFDHWSYFSDSAIMGDSRAVGFHAFEYLPAERVLAASGNTIKSIDKSLDALKTLNPSYVFLCYGMNDIATGAFSSADEWINYYDGQIAKIKEILPNAEIVVNSILPATESAEADNKRIKQIPEYEEKLIEYCAQNKITFVDCDQLVSNHQDMYESDGIHFSRKFYPYWAAEMIMTAYDDTTDSGGEGTTEDGATEEGADGTDTDTETAAEET